MANRAYLCCTNLDHTYPSVRNARYREDVHTLASARDRIPLLWLALFAPGNLRTDELASSDGETARPLAPVAPRREALTRLVGAASRIEKAFPKIGPLDAHVEPFRRMLQSARGKFLTVELDEIRALSSSGRAFDDRLRKALSYLAGGPVRGIAPALCALSGVEPARRLVPPKELFARARPTKADLFACLSVVGTSHIRDVPWEDAPKVAASPRKRAPRLDQQLHDALAARDGKLACELLARGASPNTVSAEHWCLTMEYVTRGWVSVDVGRALIEAGFDMKKRRQGYTAMQRAIGSDSVEAVAAQLELGADAAHEDGFHRAPLALAACRGAPRCLELFLNLAGDAESIRTAIRHADRFLANPALPHEPEEAQRIRAAIARLHAALATASALAPSSPTDRTHPVGSS